MIDTEFVGYLILTPSYDNIAEFNERFSIFLLGQREGGYRSVVGNYDSFKFTTSASDHSFGSEHNYALFADSGKTCGIGVPSRSAFIAASTVGKVLNEQEILDTVEINDESNQGVYLLPAKMLARINRSDQPSSIPYDDTNYRNLIYDRVYAKVNGSFASQLAYISPKPSIILITRSIPIYLFLIYYKGLFILVWGTTSQLLQNFERFLQQNYNKDSYFCFCCPLLAIVDSVLVLCPSFVVSKLRKWKQVYKQKGGSILIASNLKSYLSRINVGETENFVWLDDQ